MRARAECSACVRYRESTPRRKSQQLGTGVAHEHGCREGVVTKKTQKSAHNDEATGEYHRLVLTIGQQGDASENENAQTARQPVESVRKINGIGDAHEEQDRQWNTDPQGQEDFVSEPYTQVADAEFADDHGGGHGEELSQELLFVSPVERDRPTCPQ